MTIRTREFRFEAIPLPGLRLDRGGQSFELIAVIPHVKRDGTATNLLEWSSRCLECGAAFHFRSPQHCFPENRRCAEHRRPGIKAA